MSDATSREAVEERIEQTRAELGETAAALAAKADVKARVKDSAAEKKEQVKERAAETTAQVKERAAETTAQVKERAAETTALLKERAADATTQVKLGVDEARHQFTDGDAAMVARRPIPRATLAVAVLAIAATVAAIIRRRRA
jgi:alanyl-tRNA synthetase